MTELSDFGMGKLLELTEPATLYVTQYLPELQLMAEQWH
jgi:hypothetical protein